MATLIGILSDTHGLLRPEALEALRGCRVLLHAGDVGEAEVLQELGKAHEVIAVRGNVDRGPWAEALPAVARITLAGKRFQVVHDLGGLPDPPDPASVDVVVHGHSHRPSVERLGRVLYLNPGSAGPRRFRLPVCVALLRVEGEDLGAEIVRLE